MQVVYIVGAQCTGKTTLSKAVSEHLASRFPHLNCKLLVETALSTLQLHKYTREDVRRRGERCLELQKLILDSQLERETTEGPESWDIVVSDRSGIDPLVFAHIYCDSSLFEQLEAEESWIRLKSSLKTSVVVVCKPVQQWLYDDGTRLIPLDWAEWMKTHQTFCELLDKHEIPHVVLSAGIISVESRVDFVLGQLLLSPSISRHDNGVTSAMET